MHQGRRTADLTEQLAVAGSGDFQRLRAQLARARQANADLQKVAREKVDGMRAERDALAAEVAAVRGQLTERQDDSEQVRGSQHKRLRDRPGVTAVGAAQDPGRTL